MGRFILPYEIYNDDWFNAHAGLCIKDIKGAYIPYHALEGFIQCPRSVLYKTVVHSIESQENKTAVDRGDCYSATSPDLLGHALMVGLQSGLPAAIDYYINGCKGHNPPEDYKNELINRINLVNNFLNEKALEVNGTIGFEIELKVPARGEYENIFVEGGIDAMITTEKGCYIYEIKNTNNPGWVKDRSGQLSIYKSLAQKMGYNVLEARYVFLPGWQEKSDAWKKGALQVASGVVTALSQCASLQPYRDAFKQIATMPVDRCNWSIPDHQITRCKTCACNGLCWKNNLQ